MKKNEIKTGETYRAKVSGKITTVRVNTIRHSRGYGPNSRDTTVYDVTNLATGRTTTFRSAAKFHNVVKAREPTGATKQRQLDLGATELPPKTTSIEGGVDEAPPETTNMEAEATEAGLVDTGSSNGSEVAGSSDKGYNLEAWLRGENWTTEKGISGSTLVDKLKAGTSANTGRSASGSPPPTSTGPKSKLPPTVEQQAILDAVLRLASTKVDAVQGHKVLVIEAGAGAGKTSTLRMIGDVMPGNGQYTAFNSALVAESKIKFQGTRVACNTTHSLAFQAEGKRFSHRLNQGRVRSEQVAKLLGIGSLTLETVKVDNTTGKPETSSTKRVLAAGFLAAQVMGAIKRFCQSAEREIENSHFRYLDGIDIPVDGQRAYTNNEKVREYLLPFARKAWRDLSSITGQLPFTHDHYVKIWQLNHPVIGANYILIDESQDLSPVLLDVLEQQKGSCIILVGDSAQQIYEWRGAVNALASFPEAPRQFLSQSFRFGPAIAQVANAVLETLEEPTKLRLKGLESIQSRVEALERPTAILCRTNAMAVAKLLGAITEGRRPFLVGGGSDVIAFVDAAQQLQAGAPTSHPDLACFTSWTEVQNYVKEDADGEDLKLLVKLIDEFGAKVILDALKAMPTEKDADLVISTAHKSKGREWDDVQLAADFPTMSKCGDSDRQLVYVAVTRAKLRLDVTGCPFFNGDDSIDVEACIHASTKVEAVIASQPRPEAISAPSVVPPAPSDKPSTQTFTWAKLNGAWLVRGPKGSRIGQVVDVTRKDGSQSKKTLGAVAQEFPDAVLYFTN